MRACASSRRAVASFSTVADRSQAALVGCDMVEKSTCYMRFTAFFSALPHLVGLGQWYCTGKSAFGRKDT